MVRLSIALLVIGLVCGVLALISCLAAERGEVRGLPRAVWVLVILFFPLVGSVAYFFLGRPVPPRGPGAAGTGGARPPARRPVAPDDDPEFLRRLDEQVRHSDEDLLRRWEADLRRREEDLRRRGQDGDEPTESSP